MDQLLNHNGWRFWAPRVLPVALICALSVRIGMSQCPQASDEAPTPEKFHHFTADVGGGWTGREGANIDRGNNLGGGAGVLLSPQSERYDDCGYRLDDRRWSLYLSA